MTLNFFTAQQGFQKPLIDPQSQHVGAKREYVPSARAEERDKFTTSRSSQSDDTQTSKREDDFARLVRELKDTKNAAKPARPNANLAKTDTAAETTSAEPIPANSIGLFAQAFHTKEASVTIEAPTVQEGDAEVTAATVGHPNKPLVNSANIAALNSEIQRLISEAKTSNEDTPEVEVEAIAGQITEEVAEQISDQITAAIPPETKPEEVKSIFALLASIISDSNKDSKGDEASADASATDRPLISILKNIEALAKSDEAAAITTGLSPQQLTQLQEHIQKYLNDELNADDTETLEAIAAQFVSLAPPAETKRAAKGEDIVQSKVQILPEQANAPVKKDLIQQQESNQAQNRYDARFNARYEGGTEDSAGADNNDGEPLDFKATLKNFAPKDRGNISQNAGQRFLQATGLSQNGGALTFDPLTPQSTAATTATSPLQSALTNIVTQSQNAGSTHPATQLVSATIQKAVKAGEDTNIRLKLDPPELGRVEVKMSIDKDSATKVVLTIEKPETYTLLKQDIETLQRALSDAGLDTNGDISFELADQNNDFGDQRRGNNDGQNSRHANNDNLDEDVIETTMNWSVDPNTGLMHYNALV